MSVQIGELAEKIANLAPKEQEHLMDTVAHLNFQRGLHELSEKYKNRLKNENRMSEKSEKILAKLRESRERIARNEYRSEIKR